MNDYKCMIAVTDRHLFDKVPDPEKAYVEQLQRLAGLGLFAIVLREKDLDREAYTALARKVSDLFNDEAVKKQIENRSVPRLILHTWWETALELGVTAVHLPLGELRELYETAPDVLQSFSLVGTSVHSVQDALLAEACGADYCFAGNVWETSCKPGLEAKGLRCLEEIARTVSIPVYAIGGVTMDRMPMVLSTGAAGGCMRSGFMHFQ